MTELERHIAKLLLDNDCVIVPGFGGFMAHHIAASYDEKSHIFLPPTRTVGFNPRLTMNDSVLAQDYVSCYDLSYPEALKRIESEVDEFRQMILGEDGGHELCGIGRLYALENGEYDFIPNDNGITTSVLPTPVGPTKSSDAIGLSSSTSPAFAIITASTTLSTALS